MDYAGYTREQLLQRIEELEALNRELLTEKQQEAKHRSDWTDCLGRWYWNIKTDSITFNPFHPEALCYDKTDVPEIITRPFIKQILHPDDYQMAMDAMENFLSGKEALYAVDYRLKAKNGEYRWFYDRGWITRYDDYGKPVFVTGIIFDITEKKNAQLELEIKNKLLEEISSIDGLTKISNHRTSVEYLSARMEESARTKKPLSVALFDIDDFKNANDNKGHLYGDQVLIDVASIIKRNIRETDFAGRYGGDEFIVIFNADLLTAFSISERIRRAVENGIKLNGSGITISCGLRQYKGESLNDLIRAADKKLYEAKKRGKNQIVS